MPKTSKDNKDPQKVVENTRKRNGSRQTRSSQEMDAVNLRVAEIQSPRVTKTKQRKVDEQPVSIEKSKKRGNRRSSVARRIQFDEIDAAPVDLDLAVAGQATNNNATIVKETLLPNANKKKLRSKEASHDPHVVDNDVVHYGNPDDHVNIGLDPDESDEFGTESDESVTVANPDTNEGNQPNAMMSSFYEAMSKQENNIRKIFTEMLDERLGPKKGNSTNQGEEGNGNIGKGNDTNQRQKVCTETNVTQVIKSPSDTTIYTPAVNRARFNSPRGEHLERNIMNKIASIAESMRLTDKQQMDVVEASTSDVNQPMTSKDTTNQGLEEAKRRAERVILEAEKYKEVIEEPGEFLGNKTPIGMGLTDDDFFHLTCHVDSNLVAKIEKGEFIELEKLIPRDKRKSDNRMEWVHSDGATYLAPVGDRFNKINSYKKWEQAFRVYATIYCGANPNRSREIWQYVSVINTASLNYVWENVQEYDITFRHLMAFNPARSWAVTYNQMWNLCMKEPLQRNQFGAKHFGGGNFGKFNSSNQNQGNGSKKKGKPDYCWNFNRGIPCKYGKNCRFVERCKYCDASTHGVNTCPKVEKKVENHQSTAQN